MYKRPSERSTQGIRIPENYGGNAFRPANALFADPPKAPPPLVDGRTESFTKASFSEIPGHDLPPGRESDLPTDVITNEEERLAEFPPTSIHTDVDQKTREEERKSGSKPLFSSLLPSKLASSTRFPFGHGIGSEELLILAMMLLVHLSGEETDNEFLLLLGLLLFAG